MPDARWARRQAANDIAVALGRTLAFHDEQRTPQADDASAPWILAAGVVSDMLRLALHHPEYVGRLAQLIHDDGWRYPLADRFVEEHPLPQ